MYNQKSILKKLSPHVLHTAVDFISIMNCEGMSTLEELLLANGNPVMDKNSKVITAVITSD